MDRLDTQARFVTSRSPYDGRPYYCLTCGSGFSEFVACSELDCDLETEIEAQDRARKKRGG